MSSTSPPVPDPAPADPVPVRSGNVLPFPGRFTVERGDGVPDGTARPGDDRSLLPDDDGSLSEGQPADQDEAVEHRDWAWVEEWRAGDEPTPWASGLALASFAALVVGIAVVVLSAGLSANPVVAVVINLLVAAGLVPAIWLSRELPVLRWIGLGAAIGVVVGWISAVGMVG